MITKYLRKSLWFGAAGVAIPLVLFLLPTIASALGFDPASYFDVESGPEMQNALDLPMWTIWHRIVTSLLGIVLFIIGLGYYSKAQGYSPFLGLLGLLGFPGGILLGVLRDKTRSHCGRSPIGSPSNVTSTIEMPTSAREPEPHNPA